MAAAGPTRETVDSTDSETTAPAGARGLDICNPTEEHRLLRQMVLEFVAAEVEPQAHDHDRDERFNLELFRKLGPLGLLGITVPASFGGGGMDATAAVIAHEVLSTSDPGFTLAYLAHAMLFVNNFFHNANDEQRRRYLDKVLTGEWVAGMCMTEPEVGTDVLGMRSRAERKGDRYLLTGRKMFITNGAVDDHTPGDLFLVYAKTAGDRVSTFVVERGFKGFSLGQKLVGKTGMRASPTAELVFDDCEVPVENRLGEEGESVVHMMRNLEIERLTLAAMGLGIGIRCLREMVRYAGERKAFGRRIADFGQIQHHVATSFAEVRSARAYVYETALHLDLGKAGQRVDADGAKLAAAGMAKRVADRAIQVFGGYGYFSEFVVERLWRDAKLLEIGGGTIEAHEKNITKDLVNHPEWLPR